MHLHEPSRETQFQNNVELSQNNRPFRNNPTNFALSAVKPYLKPCKTSITNRVTSVSILKKPKIFFNFTEIGTTFFCRTSQAVNDSIACSSPALHLNSRNGFRWHSVIQFQFVQGGQIAEAPIISLNLVYLTRDEDVPIMSQS
ncbi:unnamed protein product, partial [Nesidiocoris tenuis]